MAAGLRGYQGYAANLGGHPQHPFATGKTSWQQLRFFCRSSLLIHLMRASHLRPDTLQYQWVTLIR